MERLKERWLKAHARADTAYVEGFRELLERFSPAPPAPASAAESELLNDGGVRLRASSE
jgi:hypothetical protein